MTEFPVNDVVALIIALIMAIYAWWQKNESEKLKTFFTSPVSVATADSASVVQKVNPKSWKMEDWTKRWITFGESEEDKKDILMQVDQAEKEGLTAYTIHYSKGYYQIEWGLIKASGRDGK